MVWLRMAGRFTRGGGVRLALTVLAIAWGVALVGAVRLANHAVLRAFVEVADMRAGRAELEVVACERGGFSDISGVHVVAPEMDARQADLRRVTESLRMALQTLGLFGLVAAFLIAVNRLSTAFEERAWQLGMLRAVGVRTGAVWRGLVGESLLIGAAGVALGIPLGLGLGRLLVLVIATTGDVINKLIVPEAPLAPEPGSLVVAGAFGFATALLAAAFRTWRAVRGAVAEMMRSRGSELPGAVGRVAWVPRGVAFRQE